jgi:hypothetical protein
MGMTYIEIDSEKSYGLDREAPQLFTIFSPNEDELIREQSHGDEKPTKKKEVKTVQNAVIIPCNNITKQR